MTTVDPGTTVSAASPTARLGARQRHALRHWGGMLPFLMAAALLLTGTMRLPYDLREHDIGSHLAYIHLVQEGRANPRADACWECHQPALYYVLVAGLLAVARCDVPPEHPAPDTVYPGARLLQRTGAAFGFGTIVFWLLTVRLVLERPYERFIASAFVTFWPPLFIHSCRIGNDSLFYMFASASLWSLVSWRRSGRVRHLVGAALAAGLATNTKVNGLVVILVVACSLAAAVATAPRGQRRWSREAIPGAVAVAFVTAVWGFSVFHWKQGTVALKNFDSMGETLKVYNTWRQFVHLNLKTFSKDPFVHIGGGSGRDEFWNFLFRSSLFGQFFSEDPTTTLFAYGLAGLAVAFLPFLIAGLVICGVRALRRNDAGHRELVLTHLGFVAFLVALRRVYPWAPHNDFRFILPIVCPCAVMVALALGRFRRWLGWRWPHLAALPAWLVVAFCIAAARITVVWP